MSYDAITDVAEDNGYAGVDITNAITMIRRGKHYDDAEAHSATRSLARTLRSLADEFEKAADK